MSIAHKAKGREWPAVKIAKDFPEPKDTDQHDNQGRPIPVLVSDTDARLAHVAVTRARSRLDLGGLSWIDSHFGADQKAPSPQQHRPWSRRADRRRG